MKIKVFLRPQGRTWGLPNQAGRAILPLVMLVGTPALSAQMQDLINQAHSQRDRYAGWRPPANEYRPRVKSAAEREADAWAEKMARQDQAEAERVTRQKAHFADLDARAGEAFRRHDNREGLRLLKELEQAHLEAGIYSPQLKESIGRTEASIAWREAKTSAEFRRAIAIQPHAFSPDNLQYVENIEAIEAFALLLPERDAQAKAAMRAMHTMIENLASHLDDPSQPDLPVLDHGTPHGTADAFVTRRSNPLSLADDGTSAEHEAIRSRLGFDYPGQIYIKERSGPPSDPITSIVTPPPLANDPVLERHPTVLKLRDYEATADKARHAAAALQARYEDAATKNPAASDLLLLRSAVKEAESKAESAGNMVTFQIKEIERTVTFAPFVTGGSARAASDPANKARP